MDHHGRIGGSGTLEGSEDRVYKGFRPAMVAIPRFRNVNQQQTDFFRGYGVWGGAYRVGVNSNQDGIGVGLKTEFNKIWTMEDEFGHPVGMLPYFENKVEIDENKKHQWGLPMIKVTAEYKENEMLMRKDTREQIEEMLEVAGLADIRMNEPKPVFGDMVHEMGTARMGRDPKTSVLNAYNQCHGRSQFICHRWIIHGFKRQCEYISDLHGHDRPGLRLCGKTDEKNIIKKALLID